MPEDFDIDAPIMVNINHLMGIAEVATFFDVNPTTVSNWAYRRTSNQMPQPVAELRCGTIYDISQLLPWWIDWKPSKGSRAGTIDPYRILTLGLEVTE